MEGAEGRGASISVGENRGDRAVCTRRLRVAAGFTSASSIWAVARTHAGFVRADRQRTRSSASFADSLPSNLSRFLWPGVAGV